MTQDRFLDLFGSAQGGRWRDDDEVMQAVAEAFAAATAAPTPPPVVFVQQVDEYVADGVYRTSFECVDRRQPKGERIFKVVQVPVSKAWVPVIDDPIKVLAEPVHTIEDFTAARNAADAAVAIRAPIGGAGYVYQAVDTDEYWHDSDAEQLANAPLYNVISGCGLTYDAADLTVDLAAGAISHTGAPVVVAAAANGYTLVADASNKRWAALTVSSAGAPVLVTGDAAVSASVEPTKPEPGDRVVVGMAKIQAAQTVANNCEYKLDKRIPHPGGLVGYAASAATTTNTTATTLVTLSTLGFNNSIPVGQRVRVTGNYRKTATNANVAALGLTINATSVLAADATANVLARTSGTNQAEDGMFEVVIAPRSSANYLNGVYTRYMSRVSATGAYAIGDDNTAAGNLANPVPNAAITSIIITGINNTANNNIEVYDVRVYVDGGC